jgi:hypothetical protein
MSPTPATKRINLIRRTLYASLTGSLLAIACSLSIYIGYLSFFLTPVTTFVAFVYTITLLATSAENLKGTRPPAGKHHLPALCRKPTIVFAYVISVGWLAAFGTLVYFQVDFWKLEPSERQWQLRGLSIAEMMLAVSNAGMMVMTGVLCTKERKEDMARPARETFTLDAAGKKGKWTTSGGM